MRARARDLPQYNDGVREGLLAEHLLPVLQGLRARIFSQEWASEDIVPQAHTQVAARFPVHQVSFHDPTATDTSPSPCRA